MTNPSHTFASPFLQLQATPDESTVVAAMPSGREKTLVTSETNPVTGGSVFSGGLSGYLNPRAGLIRASALGDSLSTRDSAASWTANGLNGPLLSGMLYCTQMISNGAVQLVGAYGMSGYTTTQIYSTVQSNGKTLLQSAIDDSSKFVFVLAGTNDTYGAPSPDAAATIFGRILDNLWSPILSAGKCLVAHTIPPQSPSTPSTAVQRAAAQQVNALIRDYCAENDISLVDIAAMWKSADGSNQGARTALLSNESGSYIHQNESGGMVVAAERWRILQMRGARQLVTEGVGVDSPYSIGTNPHGVGSNATAVNRTVLGAGVTGTAPHGWNISRSGTSTAVVDPAAVARDDNRDGQSVQIAATIAGAGEQIKVFVGYNGAIAITGSGANRVNSTLYAPGEVKKFSNGLWYKALVLGTSAGSEPGSLPTAIGSIIADGTQIWMKTPEIVAGAWVRVVAETVVSAHAGANLAPYAYCKQYATGYANLAAAVEFEGNDGALMTAGNGASSWGSVQGGALPGNHGYAVGILPLNTKLRHVTPWVQIAADCAIVEPCLAIIGAAGASATVRINHADLQIRA